MSDELRNRIASIIHEAETPQHDHGETLAQMIVEELGLAVETRQYFDGRRDQMALVVDSRIVSRWERE